MEMSTQSTTQFKAMVTIELEADWFEMGAPVRGCVQHLCQPRPGDSLVIMEAGWRSIHQIITSCPIIANGKFEFGATHTCLLGESIYQICYVDSDDLVLGFSKSFTISITSTPSDIQTLSNIDILELNTKVYDKEILPSLSSSTETDFKIVGKQMAAASCDSCMLRPNQPPQYKTSQDTASQTFSKTSTDACTQTEILHQDRPTESNKDLHNQRENESRLAIQIQQCVIECLTSHLNTLMTSLAEVVDSDSE